MAPRTRFADPARRGTGLVMAMFVMVTIAALVIASSDNVYGVHLQLELHRREQACAAAAEAICAQKEEQVAALAAQGDHQALIDFRLPGQPAGKNYGVQWFGDCEVKWRVEPFTVEELNDPAAPLTPDQIPFINNPDPGAPLPGAPQQANETYYHFRIAAQATWYNSLDEQVCRVQAFRWIQLTRESLFKYALFFAQEGPKGDLELCNGPDLEVHGGIHTNGAMYIGAGGDASNGANLDGGGADYLGPVLDAANAFVKPISVTAVDGIFRQWKKRDYYLKGGANYPKDLAVKAPSDTPDPMRIDDASGLAMSSSNRFINPWPTKTDPAEAILWTNDSHTPDWAQTSMDTWKGYVRTAATGATVVKTLSNIPELAGRPLEPQRLSDAPGILEKDRKPRWWTDASLAAETADPALSHDTDGAPIQVDGVYLDDALGTQETQQPAYSKLNLDGDGYVHVYGGTARPTHVGLILRERPKQRTLLFPNGAALPDGTLLKNSRPSATVYASDPTNYGGRNLAADTQAYLQSRYQVFFGDHEVTQQFFTYAAATIPGVPAASESDLVNKRLYLSQSTLDATQFIANARQSILTLNLDVVQDFLKTTNGVVAGFSNGDVFKDHFNGLIYLHRSNPDPVSGAAQADPALFYAAIRIARADHIDWQHVVGGSNPLGTSGLTIVTPNPAFLWGNVNTVTFDNLGNAYTDGTGNTTPMALMCDMATILSPTWVDRDPDAVTPADLAITSATDPPVASDGTYHLALVVNNWPVAPDNITDDGAANNFAWLMEDWWSGPGRQWIFSFKGSVVVLNGRRYARGYNLGAARTQTADGLQYMPPDQQAQFGQKYVAYDAPHRDINFNDDLTTKAGTPPFTPFGVSVTRHASYIESLAH